MAEDEMVGWHHQFNGLEFEQTLGGGERQGNLVCCSPWACKESNTTERRTTTKQFMIILFIQAFHMCCQVYFYLFYTFIIFEELNQFYYTTLSTEQYNIYPQ